MNPSPYPIILSLSKDKLSPNGQSPIILSLSQGLSLSKDPSR